MVNAIFLLDTDTLIFLIRGLKSTRQAAARDRALMIVEQCRRAQNNGIVGLSAITISELEFGARKSGRYETEISAVRKILAPFDIFDYDSVLCPQHYGRIRYALEAKGAAIGSMDLLIAAHALSLDATLVSHNVSHFSRVEGLKSVSWIKQ